MSSFGRKRAALLLTFAAFATVGTGIALSYWSGTSGVPVHGAGAAAATSVNQGSTPSVATLSTSDVAVSWTATTMADGTPVDSYLVKRYDAGTGPQATVLASCAGPIAATGCTESGVPAGDWKYTVTPIVASNWRGAESAKSATTTVLESVAPTQAFSLSSRIAAFLNGTTLYYKGDTSGSFTLLDTVTDSGSGPASAAFPAIATGGWTHGAETVVTPTGGPYASSNFTWTAGPSNPSGYTVTGRDTAGNATSDAINFVSDTTPPAGGGISYADGVVTSPSVPIATTAGTDSQSGIDAGSQTIRRAQATLDTTTQTCGVFGGFATTVTLSGGADTSVSSGNCYMYESLISDNVGNQVTYGSAFVVKVSVNVGGLPVALGRADPFVVLGASTVTNAGPSVLNGDLGLSPGTSCTGMTSPCTGNGPGTVNGSIHVADSTASNAQLDLGTAISNAAGRTATGTLAPQLGGTTRYPGVYDSTTGAFGITGTLTLDGNGDPNSVFIFTTATDLNTPTSNSIVNLTNGARACNVFWQVGTLAALGGGTTFRGNILASTITVAAGALVDGRLLAKDAAVTLSSNNVTRMACA
jgi:Ice-binding-like